MNINPHVDMDFTNNNVFGWTVSFTDSAYEETEAFERNDFYNPSVENSIKASKFLTHLDNDFNGIKPIQEKHFHFPTDAMLKLIPFKILSKIRWNSTLAERLEHNTDNCAEILGFNKSKDGKFITPYRQGISWFFNKRLGLDGYRKLFIHYIGKVKQEMDKNGIPFGERVGLDSTPLPTLKNDGVGVVNGHYYETQGIQQMVKVHTLICLDTGIPIAMCVSDGVAYDGDYLIPLLEKAKLLGIDFKEVVGDGHYGSIENWAKVSIYYGAKCYFNLSTNAKIRQDGTYKEIQKQYQKFHNSLHKDWKLTKDINEMANFLVYHDKFESVGAYFRNKHLELKKTNPDEYNRIRGRRELCENFHSIIKEQLNFDKNLSGKGWKKIEIYALQFLITIIIVALIRAENDVKDGFMKISDGVFS